MTFTLRQTVFARCHICDISTCFWNTRLTPWDNPSSQAPWIPIPTTHRDMDSDQEVDGEEKMSRIHTCKCLFPTHPKKCEWWTFYPWYKCVFDCKYCYHQIHFMGSQCHTKVVAARVPTRTLLGELTALPQTPRNVWRETIIMLEIIQVSSAVSSFRRWSSQSSKPAVVDREYPRKLGLWQ